MHARLELVGPAHEIADEVTQAGIEIPVVTSIEPAARAIPRPVTQAASCVPVAVPLGRIEGAERECFLLDHFALAALRFENRVTPENRRPLDAQELRQPVLLAPGTRVQTVFCTRVRWEHPPPLVVE